MAHFLLYWSDGVILMKVAALFMGAGFGLSTPLINNITVERSTPAKKTANLSYYSMATFGGQFLSSLAASIAVGKNAFIMKP